MDNRKFFRLLMCFWAILPILIIIWKMVHNLKYF